MNYITHLNKAFEKFCEDDRLTPFHVSLYFSLFQFWNMARFRNPISISRDELMRSSKIGSVNTYIRCIKELNNWQYIKYIPSFNPQKGSQVHLYNFNNSNSNGSDISTDKGNGKARKKAADKAGETQVIPSINNSNKLNNTNSVNENEHKRTKNNRKSSDSSGGRIKKRKKVAPKKVEASGRNLGRKSREKKFENSSAVERPTINQIKTHFTTMQWPPIEAQKFFNYFQSNGWLVGGKTPMKNWQAAAANWMLNSEKFSKAPSQKEKSEKVRSNTKTDKNYGEPL